MQIKRPNKAIEYLQTACLCTALSIAGLGIAHMIAEGLTSINTQIEQAQTR